MRVDSLSLRDDDLRPTSVARRWPQVSVDGIRIDALSKTQLHDYIAETIRTGNRARVLNVNVHALNISCDDLRFQDVLRRAEVVFCDGSGVVLAARLLGTVIPERITYADWMWEFGEFATRHDISFYFLGGAPGVAEEAKRRMRDRIPNLRIVGAEHGYFDKQQGSAECLEVVARINKSGANVLVTGFGMPIQEKWIDDCWGQLDVNIALSGGAVFDYLSGFLTRPPAAFRKTGMEWLGRLLIEPRRLGRRYVLGNPRFVWRQLLNLARRGQSPG